MQTSSEKPKINTLGALKQSGYVYKTIKQELQDNLKEKLKKGLDTFEGIIGYEDTVIPELERAILSGHNINLLGLRGQAKTRIARSMVSLLDEWIPVVEGSELNEDPLNPISNWCSNEIAQHGDATPINWIHKTERYAEKLATPDVSIADLIGDIDPIKAANLRLSFADDRVIHYGIVPRSNRCIFVINEIPDLQARIQVALFNILQEGDIQIRGYKLRIPLDMQFIFTANPEDYTNRGSIVTPLKDRIGSQIITHYPKSREVAKAITQQEAAKFRDRNLGIKIPELAHDILEQISIEARNNEFVDVKSGVSARLSISAYENLMSGIERRMLINNETSSCVRMTDFYSIVPAITGKIELVYEGEQEGAALVAHHLIGKAIRTLFTEILPNPEKAKKKDKISPYQSIETWFADENILDLFNNATQKSYEESLKNVAGLKELSAKYFKSKNDIEHYFFMEFILFGLAEYSKLNKKVLERSVQFKVLFGSYFSESSNDIDS